MERFAGPTGGVAALALTAGLACDAGGFNAISWDRVLVGVCAAALLLVILAGGERAGVHAATLLTALGLLTAWTAASWLWSESPPRALVESQRVALYLAVAAAAVLAGRRVPLPWIAAGVCAGATLVAVWNLVVRAGGVANPEDSGALDRPVGYANGLALLCVVGLLLLPLLPRLAWPAAPLLAADLAIQSSTGSLAALAAGVLAYVFVARPRLRRAVVAIAIAGLVAAPFAFGGHERGQYWRAASAEAEANAVLGSGAGTFSNWWLRERAVPTSTQEAHSLYLETLAELGPLGLALLLAALAAPLVAAVRIRAPALAAALTAYDVGAAVDFHWELAGVTAPVVLLGATAAVHASRRSRRAPVTVTVPALAVLIAAAALAYAGTARLDAAKAALQAGDRPRAARAARSALRFAPFSADAWRVVGDAESSATAYRRAIALDRNDWSLWLRLAHVSIGEPRRLALREAARLNPLASGS